MAQALTAASDGFLATTSLPIGLTEDEAKARLASEGGNAVPEASGRSWWDIVRRNLFTFINITLLVVGVVLIVMGRPRDAVLAWAGGHQW